MVLVIEQLMVNTIAQIGRDRSPNEACGLLLPYGVKNTQVIELPNRSDTPLNSFEVQGEDAVAALEKLFDGFVPETILTDIAVWHTHPAGHVGPSKTDLDNKPEYVRALVVSIPSTPGEVPLATWY